MSGLHHWQLLPPWRAGRAAVSCWHLLNGRSSAAISSASTFCTAAASAYARGAAASTLALASAASTLALSSAAFAVAAAAAAASAVAVATAAAATAAVAGSTRVLHGRWLLRQR